MIEKLSGKNLLLFLKDKQELTREEQIELSGYSSLHEFVKAIAEANNTNPDFWENDD